MRAFRIFFVVTFLGLGAVARAVYAPIPDQQQGRDLSISLEGGITYNSNIFGAATDAISSVVFEVSPKVAFNASLSQQTFFTADFHPTLDYFENRPGTKALYSQAVDARIAHSYSRTSVLDVSDSYSYNQNPESLLNGTPVNSNQTLQSNEFDAHLTFAPTEKLGMVLKARSVYYDYTSAALGSQLNRFENLYGAEFDYTLLPDLKAAGEYRHQDVDYTTNPGVNNKHSDFLMAGFDYTAGPKLTASFRLGAEHREFADLPTTTTPYAEFSLKYDYAKGSYISAGYTYDLEETSDPALFSEEKVNRMFVNIQHQITPLIVGSASMDYEPSTLVGRSGQANIQEDSTHAGLALTYLRTKNWSFTASYDYDIVNSGISSRGMNRSRLGLSGTVVY
ncbi:MAG TPA: outer membrane beta-barrel protein [Opitutaceae bacterium]|nr:outer membrane beta-barrel protein [Opitutaceae bacterium]